MGTEVRKSLAELSVVSAKLCAHSPAAKHWFECEQEAAQAGVTLLLQLVRSVDNVCQAVAYESGLNDPYGYRPLWESLDGNLIFDLEQKSEASNDVEQWW